jgi:anaerobic magnesium-protoporphyrin IX monomethyl ester cyclase
MKICLIVPQCSNPKQTYREYPLGVGLIATALRQRAFEVLVYDQEAEGRGDDLLLARLGEFRPDVIGFSVITPNYPAAQRQIRRVRRELPAALVVAGGVHASLFPADLLADGCDAVVPGDGREVMVAMAEAMSGGGNWRGLPGVVYGGADGRPVGPRPAARRPAEQEWDTVDRDVYNLPRYTHHSMMASLGCPYRCAFCCNYSGTRLQAGVRIRSFEQICAEMRYLAGRYGARQVFFADDVFLLTPGNVLAFCRRLEREGLDMQWAVQMRADAINPQVAAAMAAAGCRRVSFGVESGSEAILRRVRKGIDRETIRLAVRSAQDAGLRVKTGWIFGLPGTLEEQYESPAFMRELRPHAISIHQFIPFPGTRYYERPAEYGVRIGDRKDFASFCYGGLSDNIVLDYLSRGQLVELLESTAAVLESEGYVSSDRAAAGDEYVFSTPLNALSMGVFQPAP